MTGIVVDAGPLIALFDADDRHHAAAVAFIDSVSQPLVTNIAVVTEVAYLLSFSANTVCEFLGWADAALVIDRDTHSDLPRIAEVIRKYRDLPADFADASLIALAERRDISLVATLDADFTIYRTRRRKVLRNVFFKTPKE